MESKQKHQHLSGSPQPATWHRHVARSAVAVGIVAPGLTAHAQETFKIGVVSFLSGQAAVA